MREATAVAARSTSASSSGLHLLMEIAKLRCKVLEEEGQVVQLALIEGSVGDKRPEPEGVHLSINLEIDVTQRASLGMVVGVKPTEESLHL